MFVAVVTTVFMDVRSAERPEGGMHGGGEEEEEELPREWSKPFYYVPYFGGEGPYIEAMKEPEERTGLIWEPRYHFDQIILFFIIVNTVCLALEHHDYDECTTPQPSALCQHESYIGVMGILELIFNFVFTCEAIIKISGMGFMARPARYLRVPRICCPGLPSRTVPVRVRRVRMAWDALASRRACPHSRRAPVSHRALICVRGCRPTSASTSTSSTSLS